jgi:hypothetical protein
VLGVVAMLITSLFGTGQAYAKTGRSFDFENNLLPWSLGLDASSGGASLSLQSETPACPMIGCNHYASLKMATSDGNAVVWIAAPFKVLSEDAQYVRLDLLGRNVVNCNICVPVVYVGSNAATKGVQFKPLSAVGEKDSAKGGWVAYHYETSMKLQTTAVYVAIGWELAKRPLQLDGQNALSTSARNERLFDFTASSPTQYGGSFGFDNVNVEIYPEP